MASTIDLKKYTLEIEIYAPAGKHPPADELALGIIEALHADWWSPDAGDPYWIVWIGATDNKGDTGLNRTENIIRTTVDLPTLCNECGHIYHSKRNCREGVLVAGEPECCGCQPGKWPLMPNETPFSQLIGED